MSETLGAWCLEIPGKCKGMFIGTIVYFQTQMDHKMVQCHSFMNSAGLPTRPDFLHSHDGACFRLNTDWIYYKWVVWSTSAYGLLSGVLCDLDA